MTSVLPRFGDFIAAASRHLSAAGRHSGSVTPGRDVDDLAGALAHMTVVLMRYTADLTRTIGQLPDKQLAPLGTWDRAAIQAHDALAAAADALTRMDPLDQNTSRSASEPAKHMHAAATSLAAGRDLLQGHFSTGPTGARRFESNWSIAITSPSVRRALLAETASVALKASAAFPAVNQSATSHAKVNDMCGRLSTARWWLAQPDSFVAAAERSESTAASAREVLHAVPVNGMPAKCGPENEQQISGLLEAVVRTAERVRCAAWAAARIEPSSTGISATSWHRIAAASTVTSHHCYLVYSTLVDRLSAENDGGLRKEFLNAAAHASTARDHWLDSAREFEDVSTEIRGHISVAALEAADLAVWTGKLVYADPDWCLSSGPSHPIREAESLAPRLAEMVAVVAAAHEATEALSSLAVANLQQARSAIEGRRLLVRTRSLPERCNVPTRFAQAPQPYAVSLEACCQGTARIAAEAAESSAELASRVGAPSYSLTGVRAAVREQPEPHQPDCTRPGLADAGLGSAIGPVERKLRSMGVISTRTLWRASVVDLAGEQLVHEVSADRASERTPRQAPMARQPRALPERNSALAADLISHVPDISGAYASRVEPEAEL